MDGVGGTVKNVIFRKVKSVKVVIYSPQEFAEAVKKFAPAIHAVYLTESENIVASVGIESARKIKDTLKIHTFERKVAPNGNKYINFYKIADDEEPFHVQWYGSENDVNCGHVNSNDSDNQCPKCSRIYEEGEEWLCCPVCKNSFHEGCFYE